MEPLRCDAIGEDEPPLFIRGEQAGPIADGKLDDAALVAPSKVRTVPGIVTRSDADPIVIGFRFPPDFGGRLDVSVNLCR